MTVLVYGWRQGMELQEFGIEVATINPGPFLTGFNDRDFQTGESWEDDAMQRLYDYSKLAFPRPQFDPAVMIATMTKVVAGEVDTYRNLEPQSMLEEARRTSERLGPRVSTGISEPERLRSKTATT